MTEFKKVSREEYLVFIRDYPRKLTADVTGICEPPLETHNDFTLGNWPDSIVAKCIRDWLRNGEVDNSLPGKFWEYYVREDMP